MAPGARWSPAPATSVGFALWIDEHGLLHHSYAMLGIESYRQVSTEPIPTGKVNVRMQFDADEINRNRRQRHLRANGKQIGEGRLDRTRNWRIARTCATASPHHPKE